MFKHLDESTFLTQLLERISDFLARRRGLPILLGLILVVISFLFQSINVFSPSQLLEFLGVVCLHVGVLLALIGLLMAEVLGQ